MIYWLSKIWIYDQTKKYDTTVRDFIQLLGNFTCLYILDIKWISSKMVGTQKSISMRQNGVKGRKFVLLLTRMSCSFLIYQLTFHVQNSCISNSPQKMSACSGTVGCWNAVFSSMDGGSAQAYCGQCPNEASQASSLNMCRWTPNASHNSVLHSYPQIELKRLHHDFFSKCLYPK